MSDYRESLDDDNKAAYDDLISQGCSEESANKYLMNYLLDCDAAWKDLESENPDLMLSLPFDENDIPYGEDNPREEENIKYPVDPSNLHHRELVEEHHRKVSEEVSGDWRENLETEKAETGKTEELDNAVAESLGLSQAEYDKAMQETVSANKEENEEASLKEQYPDMVKNEMPYRQEIHKKEPEEEIKKRYPDMNPDDL